MPVSYKRKNTMKKSKSSKGSKSSKLSKRVKTPKSTKTKKRLTRKSKNGSVVRKMRGGDNDKIDTITLELSDENNRSFKCLGVENESERELDNEMSEDENFNEKRN